MLHNIVGPHMSVLERGLCLTEGVDCSGGRLYRTTAQLGQEGKGQVSPPDLPWGLLIIAKPNLG